MKTRKRQENLRHGKSKNYAAFLNASLTICSQKRTRREREKKELKKGCEKDVDICRKKYAISDIEESAVSTWADSRFR